MTMQRNPKIRKIRYLKTKTGENFSVTISKTAADQFSGCVLFETVLSDGIFIYSGCNVIKERHIKKHQINFKSLK